MIPIVKVDEEAEDKRKNKTLQWKEARLCLVHKAGSTTPTFGATFSGTVANAGKQLYHCAVQAGFGKKTQLHAVGDGATWIADQIGEQFDAQGSYLIGFYHICDYLERKGERKGDATLFHEYLLNLSHAHGETVLNFLTLALQFNFSRINRHSQVVEYPPYITSQLFDG